MLRTNPHSELSIETEDGLILSPSCLEHQHQSTLARSLSPVLALLLAFLSLHWPGSLVSVPTCLSLALSLSISISLYFSPLSLYLVISLSSLYLFSLSQVYQILGVGEKVPSEWKTLHFRFALIRRCKCECYFGQN